MTDQDDSYNYNDLDSRVGVGSLVDPRQLAQLVMAARAARQVGHGAALMPRADAGQVPAALQGSPQPPAQTAALPPTSPFMPTGQAPGQGSPASQASNPDPTKAAVIRNLKERPYAPEGMRGHELLDNTLVQGEAYNLFQASAFGNDRREHSMWVISKDGQYSFVRWPWSAETNKEIWKGPVPDGAVAIVHTHPTGTSQQPSSGDRDLATGKQSKNIKMPVYVLHKNGIWKADPGGGKDIRVRDYRWVDEFKSDGDSGR
jgi:hypothetical protein